MILIYHIVFLLLAYVAIVWVLLRFFVPKAYHDIVATYRRFEFWLEEADTAPFFRWADLVSKVAFVTIASWIGGIVLVACASGVLHWAR